MRVAEREGDDHTVLSGGILTLQVFLDSLTTPKVYCPLIGSLCAKNSLCVFSALAVRSSHYSCQGHLKWYSLPLFVWNCGHQTCVKCVTEKHQFWESRFGQKNLPHACRGIVAKRMLLMILRKASTLHCVFLPKFLATWVNVEGADEILQKHLGERLKLKCTSLILHSSFSYLQTVVVEVSLTFHICIGTTEHGSVCFCSHQWTRRELLK
jgi:hypothetical protein